MFLIGGLELVFAVMTGFPFEMVFAAAEDTGIVILPVILLGLLMQTNESLSLILKSIFLVPPVNVDLLFLLSIFSPL